MKKNVISFLFDIDFSETFQLCTIEITGKGEYILQKCGNTSKMKSNKTIKQILHNLISEMEEGVSTITGSSGRNFVVSMKNVTSRKYTDMESKTPNFDLLLDEVLNKLEPHQRVCIWKGIHQHCEGDFDIMKENLRKIEKWGLRR